MNIRFVDILRITFVGIIVVVNFNQVTSLKCYTCKSPENGDCSSPPNESYLTECGEDVETTTEGLISSSVVPSTTNSGTTESTTSTANSETSDTPSSPTTSEPSGAPSPTTTSEPSGAPSPTTTSEPSGAPSTTPVATRTSTPSSPVPSTQGGKQLRYRRGVLIREHDHEYQCAKFIYKDNDKPTIERKCIRKTENPCEDAKATHQDLSTCEICDSDGCNSSSNIGIGLISILLPISIAFYKLT